MTPETLEPRPRYIFGLAIPEIGMASMIAFVAGVLAYLSTQTSAWAAFGIGFMSFVICHIYFSSTRVIVLPEFITAVACLNWIVVPWLAYFYPPSFKEFEMIVPMDEYMSFAVPAAIALWLGLHINLRYSGKPAIFSARTLSTQDIRSIDTLILFGLLMLHLSHFLPRSLDFFYYILANVRFVGIFMLMLAGVRGWWWRAVIVYISMLSTSATSGVFYEFIMWFGYLFICVSFVKKWRLKLFALMVLAFVGVTMLNTVKMEYRIQIAKRQTTAVQRMQLLAESFVGYVTNDPDYRVHITRGDQLVRWNQGWIISRVLHYVPKYEPYANGETVWEAVSASLVPRFLFESKVGASSRESFLRFTGLRLGRGTSMGLGVAAEFYSNFGRFQGLLAVAIYGFFIGWAYAQFAKRARDNILWWAWLPFVMLASLVAEWNLSEIMNHLVKSFVVMLLLLWTVPVFRYHFRR